MAVQDSSQLPITNRLGEELPLFCEKCGYNLNGLSQAICEHCSIRHFHCPECGHHQPINTLRPAFQHLLGRMRAAWLIVVMLAKIAFFGLALVSFGALCGEWLYRYDYLNVGQPGMKAQIRIRDIDLESLVVFGIFAFSYGLLGRMFLLRWKSGIKVGMALAGLAVVAMIVGVELNRRGLGWQGMEYPSPYVDSLLILLAYVAVCVVTASVIVWPIWVVLVRAFLPKRVGESLLEWQRAQSHRITELARDA